MDVTLENEVLGDLLWLQISTQAMGKVLLPICGTWIKISGHLLL